MHRSMRVISLAGWLLTLPAGVSITSPAGAASAPEPPATAYPPSAQDLLANSKPSDWRALDPAHTLYMLLPAGRVVIELTPAFAPLHVASIEKLVRAHYFDGLAVLRVQDDYVAQWGDPTEKKSLGDVPGTLPPEFSRPLESSATFRRLPDGDVYASQVGFIDSWPVARNPALKVEWLTHCYGMVGVGRDNAPDSGSGAELYAIIGHAPRQLDRNVTLVGRVVQGIELLSSLPRGTGALGFYEKPEQDVPLGSVVLASEAPPEQRLSLQVLRTDTPLFSQYLQALRSRHNAWFVEATNRIELCNVKIPVRLAP